MATALENQDEPLPGPFISYSRRNLDFARRLFNTLRQRKRNAWVDLEGIEPSEEWLAKLNSAIDSAPAFVFIISEDSVASAHCTEEIRRATANNKKIIPLLYRQVEESRIPPAIGKLQWISFIDEKTFESAIDELIQALDTDWTWVAQHARLLVRAKEWQRQALDKSYLLRGKDLQEAEQWLLESAKGKDRQPTPLHSDFIGASEQAQKRTRNRLLTGISAAAVIASLLAVAALYQRNLARQNERVAVSRLVAAQATANVERSLNLSILLAVAAYRRAPTFEARQALLSVIHARPHVLRYFYGHSGRIQRLAFDSSGKLLMAAATDGRIIAWNVAGGEQQYRLEAAGKFAPAVTISSAANLLAVGRADGTVQLHELRTGKLLQNIASAAKAPVTIVAFSDDGRWLAWGDDAKQVTVWNLRPGALQCVSDPSHPASLNALRFATDGRSLASMDHQGVTVLWKTENCLEQTRISFNAAGRVASINSDLTRTAVTQEGFPEVFISDVSARTVERLAVKHSDFLLSLDFHPAGKEIALGTRDAAVVLWQPAGNKIARTLRAHRSEVTGVAFDRSGQTLASGTIDGEIIVWDLTRAKPMEPSQSILQPSVASVFFMPDSRQVVAVNREGKAELREIATAKRTSMNPPWPVALKSPALSSDGAHIAARTDKSIIIRQTKDGTVVEQIAISPSAETPLAFSPDSRLLVFSDHGEVFLWNLATRTKSRVGAANRPITALTFFPTSHKLAFTTADRSVAIFDRQTGQTTHMNVSGHTGYLRSLAVSPDGRTLAAGGGMYDGNISLWNLDDGRQLRILQPNDPTDVTTLLFSPDGQTLATVTAYSDMLRLWDVTSGRLIGTPIRVQESLDFVTAGFSPNGNLLATVERDSIVLRDLNPENWMKEACRAVNRNLTPHEWRDYIGQSSYQTPCPELPSDR